MAATNPLTKALLAVLEDDRFPKRAINQLATDAGVQQSSLSRILPAKSSASGSRAPRPRLNASAELVERVAETLESWDGDHRALAKFFAESASDLRRALKAAKPGRS